MKRILNTILFWGVTVYCYGQATSGTTGLLNIPSAEMQQDGMFMAGGNFLPENLTPERFSYNTGNYYFNITFLPFIEINYRLTLLKSGLDDGRYSQQDRSFGARLRVLNEKKYLPAITVGGNDLYTSSSGDKNQNFGCLYVVSTKTFSPNMHHLGFTLGYGFDTFEKGQAEGLMGGVSFSPSCCKQLRLMADYDTQSVNMGGSVLFFGHLYLHAFLNDFSNFVAGGAILINLY